MGNIILAHRLDYSDLVNSVLPTDEAIEALLIFGTDVDPAPVRCLLQVALTYGMCFTVDGQEYALSVGLGSLMACACNQDPTRVASHVY